MNTINNVNAVMEMSKKETRSVNSKLHPLRAPFAMPCSYGDITR